ncbi:c-type cytochrome [Pseudoclavibacter chungangensis]|uniref:Cytochrome bc1 complex cytochrome c subunit n=1 Tax=Pseudoclavibacter chungangensis TaxID=587635 RepID=A0A7J5C211_9MICO|nr:cytochrome c [Pseudoclavibacter chungangensis]KAB1660130.1 c-type cytochrome [Pseudoclavibacter chungangensis]NYJ66763.1 ubiquinol-cytochrome c reductase cytochrome c subunit [Pseudoclavibacter chungangensis]
MFLRKSTRTSSRTSAKRRAPLATAALLGIGLLATGGAYALVDDVTEAQADSTTQNAADVAAGESLFNANCATCHGMDAVGTESGPSLVGVGAAAVDFQVGTGRMPMQNNAPQAPKKPLQFTDEQISQLAVYVASLGPGPAIPDEKYLLADGDAARGAELFRINCAMCHNVAGAGGALTEGKFAPELQTVEPVHLYEAMITGPQNMPVFNDANLTPQDKADIITALQFQTHVSGGVGGLDLGSLGPVSEGLFIWIIGIGGAVMIAIWLTRRAS